MANDLEPNDVRGQGDLARAMESIKTFAGISYREIESSSGESGSRIAVSTAKNLTTPGKSLPTERSLRAFLRACKYGDAEIDDWCIVLDRLRYDTGATRAPSARHSVVDMVPTDDELWRALLPLPLLNRVSQAESMTVFPAVRDLVELAASLLAVEYETSATYTLHGVQHSIATVVRLGQLLGADVKKLNAHESGLLVVGAFFHDVGRHPNLPIEYSTSQVRRYLDQTGEATDKIDSLSTSVLEDYCAWDRTRRLDEYLKRLPPELLDWDGVPIREALGALCAEQARPLPKSFAPDPLPGVDIALCAGLLRLATRLELCSLRSARDIYRRLGIKRRGTPRTSAGDLEWTDYVRRLAFTPRRQNADYIVEAEAIVVRSVAEFDFRNLVEELAREFAHCRRARARWSQQLPLPDTVDLGRLKGIGYTYEKLTFELVRDDVLQLLGGTKLYGNPYVFVRELLQNAVDAVRLRRIVDPGYGPGNIAISSWEDNGAIWFRIDDDGVGMDLQTIREYFLQIGRSYYNSDDLDRELRQLGRQHSRFRAISRFGIGVMSCFMLGDRIEVSTRKGHGTAGRGDALRLSIDRREDFATLRCEGQGHDPIPADPGSAPLDFRMECGTTVAVRIDAAEHYVPPSLLLRHAAYFHFTAECTLTLNGTAHAGVDLRKPILDCPKWLKRTFGKSTGSEFTGRYLGKATVHAVPLDLTESSPDPRVQGQLVALVILPPSSEGATMLDLLSPGKRSKLSSLVRNTLAAVPVQVAAHANLTQLSLRCHPEKSMDDLLEELEVGGSLPMDDDERHDQLQARLKARYGHEFDRLDVQVLAYRGPHIAFTEEYDGFAISEEVSSTRWWGHNGVTLPTQCRHEYLTDTLEDDYTFDAVEFSKIMLSNSSLSEEQVFLVGNVGFTDDLRPDLTLARDELEAIPFGMPVALLLALSRAIPDGLPSEITDRLRDYCRHGRPLLAMEHVELGSVLAAVRPVEDAWLAEPLIVVDNVLRTAAEVIDLADRGEVMLDFGDRIWRYYPAFFDVVGAALAQERLNLRWRTSSEPGVRGNIVAGPGAALGSGGVLNCFPPFLFMHYADSGELRAGFGPWNSGHPLCKWFLSCGEQLRERVPGHFSELREVFVQRSPSALFYCAREKERQGLLCLEDLLDDYSTDELIKYEESMDDATADRLVLKLIAMVVSRIGAVAPDLLPVPEVQKLLGV